MRVAQDLMVAARRWRQVSATAATSDGGATEREDLRQWFREVSRGQAAEDALRTASLFELEAGELPWRDTGLDLEAGEWVTTAAAGRLILSGPLDLWVGPQFQLWMRVGETGRIFNGTRDTHSFCVAETGRLYLAGYFPGQWGDDSGRVSTSLGDYSKFAGGLTVAVLRWRGQAQEGMAALGGGRYVAAEQERLRDAVSAPRNWKYLWMLGQSEIFQDAVEDGRPCIACHTERNVGILQHDAPFDLTPETTIRWDWKLDELPSRLPENTALSHDYLSVAVEFENGRDITYTWSPELPLGTGYWCPLPTWKDREFHVVIRSGAEGLGTWLAEERNLFEDYRRYMGEPPRRVVKVWLIAVSIFQRQRGVVRYRGIALDGGSEGRRLEIS